MELRALGLLAAYGVQEEAEKDLAPECHFNLNFRSRFFSSQRSSPVLAFSFPSHFPVKILCSSSFAGPEKPLACVRSVARLCHSPAHVAAGRWGRYEKNKTLNKMVWILFSAGD